MFAPDKNFAGGRGVEGTGWLVKQNHFRFHRQRTRDSHTLLLPARELRGKEFFLLAQPHLGQILARELNGLCGLADHVQILHGSALSLPLPDNGFDRAYSQVALMNIADKRSVFREMLRVLRPGGLLALSLAGAGSVGNPHYPLPWATTTAISFLSTPDEVRSDLLAAGFQIVFVRDTAAAVSAALAPVLKQLETEGLPPLGEHVVTGENAKEWRINVMRSTAEGRLSMIEAVARKPA